MNRKLERETLQECLKEAHEGRGGMLLLVGEVGTGKSRLAEELAVEARLHGMVSLRGPAADPHGLPLLSPFAEATLEYQRKTGEQLRETVTPEQAATLDALLEDDFLSRPSRPLRSMHDYASAIRAFLYGLAAHDGLLLHLDDVGSLDEASLYLLGEMIPSLSSSRFLILATCDPLVLMGEGGVASNVRRWEEQGTVRRLSLAGLTAPDAEELVRQLAGAEHVEPEVASLFYEKSLGHPLLLEELLQMCLRDHNLEVHEGTLRGRAPRGLDGVATVDDLLTCRLRNLPEKVAGVLSIAACIGCAFDFQILNRVAGLESDELVSVLKWAARCRLIEEEWSQGRERFRFSHDALHARLYTSLEPRGRKRMHLLIGGAIEELFEPFLPRFYASLVWHYRQSGQWKKALQFAVLAGDFYAGLGMTETAGRCYQDASDFATRNREPESTRMSLASRATGLTGSAAKRPSTRPSKPRPRKKT